MIKSVLPVSMLSMGLIGCGSAMHDNGVINDLEKRWGLRCGNDLFVCEPWRGLQSVSSARACVQYRNVGYQIEKISLTDADRLNGVNERFNVSLTASAYRLTNVRVRWLRVHPGAPQNEPFTIEGPDGWEAWSPYAPKEPSRVGVAKVGSNYFVAQLNRIEPRMLNVSGLTRIPENYACPSKPDGQPSLIGRDTWNDRTPFEPFIISLR